MDEFGKKAKDGLLHGIQFLKDKAQETMDLQKLNGQVRSLEQRRDECLQEVGQRVYVFFEMDRVQSLQESDWESIRPRIDELKEIKRKLQATEEQIVAVKSGQHIDSPREDAPPT